MKPNRNARPTVVVCLLMTASVLACQSRETTNLPAQGGAGQFTGAPAPSDMAMAVEFADLIVEGEIIDESSLGVTYGYADGELLVGTPDSSHLSSNLQIPLMEYLIRVDVIYKAPAGLSVGDEISLRMEGEPGLGDGCDSAADPSLFDEFPVKLEPIGVSRLFFLLPQSDGLAYGMMFGGSSRLDLTGTDVMTTDCHPDVVRFSNDTSPVGFLAELAAVIAAE